MFWIRLAIPLALSIFYCPYMCIKCNCIFATASRSFLYSLFIVKFWRGCFSPQTTPLNLPLIIGGSTVWPRYCSSSHVNFCGIIKIMTDHNLTYNHPDITLMFPNVNKAFMVDIAIPRDLQKF